MNYHNFEDDIHALVLELGKEYFDKGAVHDLDKTEGGWRACVEGTASYNVTLDGTEAVDASICNCPYDHGPVCKHVAATLYAVREKVLSEFADKLDGLSEGQLRKVVRNGAVGSRGFSEWLVGYLDSM